MEVNSPKIEVNWLNALKEEFNKEYFLKLKAFLVEERKQYQVFPPGSLIFNTFNLTPFDEVKVVILGQDPYHGPGQAHGLSFSVPDGVKSPPSLVNIFKEIQMDLGVPISQSGNLTAWAKQGVLLLNATLTVRANQPGSHQNKGWENFTDTVIKKLSEEKTGLVFLLWGNYAKNKIPLIDSNKHLILTAPHPSPLARGGFFNCKHFSKTNEYLKSQQKQPIDWKVL
ncbi:MAG TPA: uracil-DNA glycosylase [Bacteroidia bacterium]|jgi:uracil-DNA glycosylase|nr:uracil-DNA glycosylase [Bacteroidia bacterium]